MLVQSLPQNDFPRMENDFRFAVVVDQKRLAQELSEAVKPEAPVIKVEVNKSDIAKTIAWRYWTYHALNELSKYNRTFDPDGTLQARTMKMVKTENVRGMWLAYYFKDVPSTPFIDRVQFIRDGMKECIEFCFPSFLRSQFITAYGDLLGIAKEDITYLDDENDEYFTPQIQKLFTPQGWNQSNAPKKYPTEEWENYITHDSIPTPETNDIVWHPNVREYGIYADEVNHLWGNVYELKKFYTWGGTGGNTGQGQSKVTSTSRVNAQTGKIISVRVTTDDGFDGDIDENNKLKVLNDKFTPDGFVYGFKVAKTMKGELCIVKLMIPRGAKIACNVNDSKLRVDKAWVVGVFKFNYDELTRTVKYGEMINVARSFYYAEKVVNSYQPEFLYRVGDLIEVKDFDPDLGHVCVPGIHFFFSQKQLFHLIKKDVTHWKSEPEFIKGYKRVLGLKFQSRTDILKQAFDSSE